MEFLAKFTLKLSCTGLLDFKTTEIHIPTIRKIHGKIHFAQFQWQFYKAVLSRNAGVYEALLYRRALCSMLGVRLYSLSFLTGVSTVLGLALHSLYSYSIPYCAMLQSQSIGSQLYTTQKFCPSTKQPPQLHSSTMQSCAAQNSPYCYIELHRHSSRPRLHFTNGALQVQTCHSFHLLFKTEKFLQNKKKLLKQSSKHAKGIRTH